MKIVNIFYTLLYSLDYISARRADYDMVTKYVFQIDVLPIYKTITAVDIQNTKKFSLMTENGHKTKFGKDVSFPAKWFK